MRDKIDWNSNINPILNLYGKRKHPLEYKNKYQLMVMVILSAQDSDRHINELSVKFFEVYPTLKSLSLAKLEQIYEIVSSVRNSANKSKWLHELAMTLGTDENIPEKLDDLIKLPGIGRKSANVIVRETGGPAEGIIVDLHVVRVAPRLGIASGDKPEKIEKQLMEILDRDKWNDAGMAISFLGREVCRPANPKCDICVMNSVCKYYSEIIKPSGKK